MKLCLIVCLLLLCSATVWGYSSYIDCSEALSVGQSYMGKTAQSTTSRSVQVTCPSGISGSFEAGESCSVTLSNTGGQFILVADTAVFSTSLSRACSGTRYYPSLNSNVVTVTATMPTSGSSVNFYAAYASGYSTVYITNTLTLSMSSGLTPTKIPTNAPSSVAPTTRSPTRMPSVIPSGIPTNAPTTASPTIIPTTATPSKVPSVSPSTAVPSTATPSKVPSVSPSTAVPSTAVPSTLVPTYALGEPTPYPTTAPLTVTPSESPTLTPTPQPSTASPTIIPTTSTTSTVSTTTPSFSPSGTSAANPTYSPTFDPNFAVVKTSLTVSGWPHAIVDPTARSVILNYLLDIIDIDITNVTVSFVSQPLNRRSLFTANRSIKPRILTTLWIIEATYFFYTAAGTGSDLAVTLESNGVDITDFIANLNAACGCSDYSLITAVTCKNKVLYDAMGQPAGGDSSHASLALIALLALGVFPCCYYYYIKRHKKEASPKVQSTDAEYKVDFAPYSSSRSSPSLVSRQGLDNVGVSGKSSSRRAASPEVVDKKVDSSKLFNSAKKSGSKNKKISGVSRTSVPINTTPTETELPA